MNEPMFQFRLEIEEEDRELLLEHLERLQEFSGQMDVFREHLSRDLGQICPTMDALEAFYALSIRITYREQSITREELVDYIVQHKVNKAKMRARRDPFTPRTKSRWYRVEKKAREYLDDECSDYEDLISEYIRVRKEEIESCGMAVARLRVHFVELIIHAWVEYHKFRRGFMTIRDQMRWSKARRLERELRRERRDADAGTA